jgi:hypothetical protein
MEGSLLLVAVALGAVAVAMLTPMNVRTTQFLGGSLGRT